MTENIPQTRRRRWLWLMLVALIIVMAAATNGYLLGYFICGDCIAPLALLNNVDYLVLMSGIFMFVMALFVKPIGLRLLFVPSVILFLVWYGPNFLPRPRPDAEGTVIRVATYNMQSLQGDPDAQFGTILDLNADVIGLQELNPYVQSRIVRLAANEYPYRVFHNTSNRQLGLMSRYPILEEQTIAPVWNGPQGQPTYIRAVLDVDGVSVAVYVFHAPVVAFELLPLTFDDDANLLQSRAMAAIFAEEVMPALVLCDCNTTPRSRTYAVWDDIADEAYDAVGWGIGTTLDWPSNRPFFFPLIRIDYVWHTPTIVPLSAEVWGDTGTSDHHPLVAEMDIRP